MDNWLSRRLPGAWKDRLRPVRDAGVRTVVFLRRPQDGLRTLVRPRATILFYPEAPRQLTVMYKLCKANYWRVTTNPKARVDAAFLWQDATYVTARLPQVPTARVIVNAHCLDISKQTVDRLQNEIFGYSLSVDPLTYDGEIVEKSNLNGKHDGKVLTGPLEPERVRDDHVYQRLVDNRIDAEVVIEHRLLTVGGEPLLVYEMKRALDLRFGMANLQTVLKRPAEVFASSELEKLERLIGEIRLDYGEVDLLRDKDGRLYVVDVNKTPYGPPRKSMAIEQRRETISVLAGALDELVKTGRPKLAA